MALYQGRIEIDWLQADGETYWHLQEQSVRARGFNEACNKLIHIGSRLPCYADRYRYGIKVGLAVENIRKVGV